MTQQEIDLDELEAFFASINLPQTVKLDSGSVVNDLPTFLKSYCRTLRSGISPAVAEPRIYRLLKIKEILSSGNEQQS